ncbi:hypothetical protein NM688_g7628 [Phlebia brevispora]|uniref:Uncharacterized protein n=1 Tax=Phlebia brevispora TaxID=194682 RepID=A0ACC1S357_9APHY|nr:hypothetical protein NM688_g7628 [Phlebia brevispora]
MKAVLSFTTLLSLGLTAKAANLTLVQEYSGPNFFDKWDFYGDTTAGINGPWNGTPPYDDTTSGDVFYMGRQNGSSLYSVDSTTGHAFIKVDNTSFVPYNEKRDSIRITTQDSYNLGALFVIDIYHLPWGCSVWPGVWTKGVNWPNDGEIDIVEGINRATQNQMALHTLPGCNASTGSLTQTGTTGTTDCSPTSGCTVLETNTNSYGPNFESNNGGVWAVQLDTSGVNIWFWSRADIPPAITSATDSIDISSFGNPSAAYSSSTCNIGEFFGPQQLVIDITLCGNWAGLESLYADTCGNTPQVPAGGDPNSRCVHHPHLRRCFAFANVSTVHRQCDQQRHCRLRNGLLRDRRHQGLLFQLYT